MTARIGSLFSGGGGLDLAVEAVFGGTTIWHSELDPAASKVLAHRWPGVPNLGDITRIDWDAVEPVEILCGGFPCQDLSAAGKRAGIRTGTRSGLWAYYAEAIDTLRPKHVVIENVRGLLSGRAHRDMERCDPIVGNNPDGFVLRAAGAVLGDLADIGYDTCWATVSAASVGAPHRRERVFILASDTSGDGLRYSANPGSPRGARVRPGSERRDTPPTDADCAGGEAFSGRPGPGDVGRLQPVECGSEDRPGRPVADSSGVGRHERRPEPARQLGGFDAAFGGAGPVELLPTPRSQDGNGYQQNPNADIGNNGRTVSLADRVTRLGAGPVDLLPTPTSRDHKRPNQRQDDTCLHGALLPTPAAADGQRGQDFAQAGRDGSGGDDLVTLTVKATRDQQWGKYGPAIHRWEALTRPAPSPTEPNSKGNPRLNPAFSEWMLGWPDGWVTQVPGISRNDQLRIIGNGVVTACAEAALRWLLTVSEMAA